MNSLGFACQPLMLPESTISLSPRGWRSSSPTCMRLAWFRSACPSSRVFVLRSVFPSSLSHTLGSQSLPLPRHVRSERQAPVASQGRPGQRTRMITAHAMAAGRAPQRSRTGLADWAGGKFPCPAAAGPCPVSTRFPRFLGAMAIHHHGRNPDQTF